MPIDGSGNYQLPSGTTVTTNTVVESAPYNTFLADLEQALNTVKTVAQGGTGGNSIDSAQISLQVKPGVNTQAYDAGLASIAGLTTIADKILYTTASDTYATSDLSSYMRGLLSTASVSALRTAIDVPTNAEAVLQTALGTSANNVVQLDGSAKLPAVDGSQLTNVTPTRNRAYTEDRTPAVIVGSATNIPYDNTKPRINEGHPVLSVSFTPSTSTSRVRITVNIQGATSSESVSTVAAVFDDELGNDAIACFFSHTHFIGPQGTYEYVPGDTNERTISVRLGNQGGDYYLNRTNDGDRYGDTITSSLIVEEIVR